MLLKTDNQIQGHESSLSLKPALAGNQTEWQTHAHE
jgi:hypothetical protein